MLPPLGYRYAVTSDGALYVGRRYSGEEYVTRTYNVTDLLLSTEDVTTGRPERGGSTGVSGSSTSRRQSRGSFGPLSPQYADRGSASVRPQYAGRGRIDFRPQYTGRTTGTNGDDEYGSSTLTDRSQNLVLLMKQACGPTTWMSPASGGLIDVREDENNNNY
jgi:hypothetical protein